MNALNVTNYAIYRRTYGEDTNFIVTDELVGSPETLHSAIAICAMAVYNENNHLYDTNNDYCKESYCYLVFPMDKEGNVDLNETLYRTEEYVLN